MKQKYFGNLLSPGSFTFVCLLYTNLFRAQFVEKELSRNLSSDIDITLQRPQVARPSKNTILKVTLIAYYLGLIRMIIRVSQNDTIFEMLRSPGIFWC